MIILETEAARFNVRVAGVCRSDGHVLLHQAEGDDSWLLPGGHLEMGEPVGACLAREWREEIGIEVRVGRLLWVVENFFDLGNRLRHELGFYFAVDLPDGASEGDPAREFQRNPADVGYALVFRWFPVDRLETVRLYPSFLRTALADPPAAPVHVVNRGDCWILPPS